ELEEGFAVRVSGYWAHHGDFGGEIGYAPSLIGRARSAEIVVNVVLPFISAWAEISGHPQAQRRAMELYQSYPRLADNWITRLMSLQMFGEDRRRAVTSACQQQGLLHIFQAFCFERRCDDCPLG
ncbi:MAG: DUF2851 family protein, partial [Chloroflexi bacterium]|nr:DUF2851 family protein [Chloroflexota bacterium]